MSRVNLVGQGRVGKTAFADALAGKAFCQTTSTVGVEHRFMEVVRQDHTMGEDGEWRTLAAAGGAKILSESAEEAHARLAAQGIRGLRRRAPLATRPAAEFRCIIQEVMETPSRRILQEVMGFPRHFMTYLYRDIVDVYAGNVHANEVVFSISRVEAVSAGPKEAD